jgi:hypothetical protein
MYQKLMPSGMHSLNPEEETGGTEDAEASYIPPVPSAPEQQPPTSRSVAIPWLNDRQITVVNIMETQVMGKLDSLLDRFTCCRCDRCKKDIVALALNKLPPKYMVLTEGQPDPEVDEKTNSKIVLAMIQALIRVRDNPRH